MVSENIDPEHEHSRHATGDRESDNPFAQPQEFLKDGRGFTYYSVRTCELERFSAK
jgi:hypothetical protein